MESPTVLSPRQAQRKWEDMLQRLEDANAALKRRSARPGEGLEGLPDEEEVEKYIPKRTFHAFKSLKLRLAEIKAEKRRRKHQRHDPQQQQQQEQPQKQRRTSSSSDGGNGSNGDEDTDTDWSLSENEEDESVYTPRGRRRRASVVKQQLEELLEQPILRTSSSDALAPGPVLLRNTSGSFQPGASLKRRERQSTTDAAGPSGTIRRTSDWASLDRQQAIAAAAAGGATVAAAGAAGVARPFSRTNSLSARCPVLPALAECASQETTAAAAGPGHGAAASGPHKSHLAPTAAGGAGGTETGVLLRPETSSVGSSLNSTATSSSGSNNSSLRKVPLEVAVDASAAAEGLGAALGGTSATTTTAAPAAVAAAGAGSTFKRPPITGTYATRSFRGLSAADSLGASTKPPASSSCPAAEATLALGNTGPAAAAAGVVSAEGTADADWVAARLPPSRLPAGGAAGAAAAAAVAGTDGSSNVGLVPDPAAAAANSGGQQAGFRRFGTNLSITLRASATQDASSSQTNTPAGGATDTTPGRGSPTSDVTFSPTREIAAAAAAGTPPTAAAGGGRVCFAAAPLALPSASGPAADKVEAAAAALYGSGSSRRDLSATAGKRPAGVELAQLPTAAAGSAEVVRCSEAEGGVTAAAAMTTTAATQPADKASSPLTTATLGFVATAAVGFARKQRRDSVLLQGPTSPLQRTTSNTAEEAAGPDNQASPKLRPVSGWRARRLSGLCLEGPPCPESTAAIAPPPAAAAATAAVAAPAASTSSSNSSSLRLGRGLPPKLNLGSGSGAAAPGQLAAPCTADAAGVEGGKLGGVASSTSSKVLMVSNPGSGVGQGLSGSSQKFLSGSGLISSSSQLGGSINASTNGNSNNLTSGSGRSRRAFEALSLTTGAPSPSGDPQGSPSVRDSSAAIGCLPSSGLCVPASPGQPPVATDPVAAARRRRGSVLLSAPMSPRPMSPRPVAAGAAGAAGAGTAGVDVNEVLSSIKQALNTMSIS